MATVASHTVWSGEGAPAPSPSPALRRWLKLLAALGLFILLDVGLTLLGETPLVKPLAESTIGRGLNAAAWYYTAVEEVPESEMYLRSSLRFAPRD